jgi:hypothetical protein
MMFLNCECPAMVVLDGVLRAKASAIGKANQID